MSDNDHKGIAAAQLAAAQGGTEEEAERRQRDDLLMWKEAAGAELLRCDETEAQLRAEVERLTRERDEALAVLERLLSSCEERVHTGDGNASQLVAPSRAIYKEAQVLTAHLRKA